MKGGGAQRTVYVNVRMTGTEVVSLQRMMTLEGYTSRSRYIRDRLFSRPVRRRIVTLTTADVSREMVEMASQLKRIGVNVNQITRWFNSIMKSRTSQGVSGRDLSYLSSRLSALFTQAVTGLDSLCRAVDNINNQPTKTNDQPMQTITITGNLTADAEVRQGKDSERMSFKVAVNDRGGDQETTTFYSCSMRKTGVLDLLKKGKKVLVTGDFHQSTVEKDGKTFVNNNVFVTKLELLSPSPSQEDLPE